MCRDSERSLKNSQSSCSSRFDCTLPSFYYLSCVSDAFATILQEVLQKCELCIRLLFFMGSSITVACFKLPKVLLWLQRRINVFAISKGILVRACWKELHRLLVKYVFCLWYDSVKVVKQDSLPLLLH